MKKLTTLFLAAVAAFAVLPAFGQVKMKYQPDPVFGQDRIKKLHDASPAKAAVAPAKPRKMLIFRALPGSHYGGIVAAKEVLKHMGEKLGVWEP